MTTAPLRMPHHTCLSRAQLRLCQQYEDELPTTLKNHITNANAENARTQWKCTSAAAGATIPHFPFYRSAWPLMDPAGTSSKRERN